MEYSIQKLEKSTVEISVSIEKAEWENYIKEAYNKNKFRYALEGFRKGKVPFNVLVKRYGIEVFFEDAMDIAMGKAYSEILEKEKLDPVSRPQVDINVVDAEGLKFSIGVALYPEFEVAPYTGLTFKKVVNKVKKAEIDAEINRELEGNARFINVTDRAVQDGDMITLDYSGAIDGVKFEGGTAQDQALTIGSNQFIPGFEAQLIGKEIGVECDITVTFPTEYHATDLAGKDAVFTCTVKEIKVKELPALDDEFAKDLGFDKLADYKADVKARLQKKADEEAITKENEEILSTIVDATVIDIPDCMIEEELDRFVGNMKANMAQYGLKFEDYLAYAQTTEEEIRKERKEASTKELKVGMVMEAIIKKENLVPTKEDFDAEIKKMAESQGMSEEEFAKNADERTYNYMMTRLMDEKLIAFLRANNAIEEKKASKKAADAE
ncbi:MAG: trigger factor [Clostridia bacterium]|nr:trigger factor [Clostridia bacterium]